MFRSKYMYLNSSRTAARLVNVSIFGNCKNGKSMFVLILVSSNKYDSNLFLYDLYDNRI